MAKDVQDNIDSMIRDTSTDEQVAGVPEVKQPTGVYKLDPASKIPVSRFEGPVWQGRRKAGIKQISGLLDAWHEAEAYYGNSQMEHRRVTEGQTKGNDVVSRNRNRKFSTTENMVYATVNAVIPSTYAKNPNISITVNDKQQEELGIGLQHFGNNLAARQDAPGINLKPKVRKSIIRCEVTNEAWMWIGYTLKEQSADQARADITELGQKLVNAADAKEIEEIEGQLMALEECCDMLDPAGPFAKSLRGDQVIIDPNSTEDDHCDANWIMIRVKFPTNFLNARYRQKNSDGQFVSAYKATHVVDARGQDSGGVTEEQREIDNFHIFEAGKDNPNDYGYGDKQSYDRAKQTECWICFDKVKRRFYLYADNDWTWPIWVFDDPYHLPNFFPLRKLQYHTDPRKNRTKGEVSHYLDQQDDINTISDEMNRSRTALRDKTMFDSSLLDQATVESIMLDPNRKLVGIRVPDGKTLKDCIMNAPLPALEYAHLWDRAPSMSAINQISGIGEAMRGEQFKTNTTNQAIDYYSSTSSVRLDEKRDAIEDFVGFIMQDIIFLCMQFMAVDQFVAIAGSQYEPNFAGFRNMTPAEIRDKIHMRVDGGSTQKPTSTAKKAEALQVVQVLGQFASSNPYAGVVALQVLEKAFDSITIEAADWEKIEQIMIMNLQKAGQGPGAGGSPQEEAAEGEQPPPGQQQGATVDQMAQEAEKRGVPKDAAKKMILEKLQAKERGQPH